MMTSNTMYRQFRVDAAIAIPSLYLLLLLPSCVLDPEPPPPPPMPASQEQALARLLGEAYGSAYTHMKFLTSPIAAENIGVGALFECSPKLATGGALYYGGFQSNSSPALRDSLVTPFLLARHESKWKATADRTIAAEARVFLAMMDLSTVRQYEVNFSYSGKVSARLLNMGVLERVHKRAWPGNVSGRMQSPYMYIHTRDLVVDSLRIDLTVTERASDSLRAEIETASGEGGRLKWQSTSESELSYQVTSPTPLVFAVESARTADLSLWNGDGNTEPPVMVSYSPDGSTCEWPESAVAGNR
jgi:hypothetical protein